MIATLDLLRFAPGRTSYELARLARHRAALARPGRARWVRWLAFAPLAEVPRPPSPTTFGMFAIWPSAEELARFGRASPLAARWRDQAREHCAFVLEPRRSVGRWRGVDPLEDAEQRRPEDAPTLFMTYAHLRPRHIGRFAVANGHVVTELRELGPVWDTGWADRMAPVVGTLSLWPAPPAGTDFAYRHEPHKDTQRRAKDEGWFRESWFARFRVAEATGTWQGRDLMAEAGRG